MATKLPVIGDDWLDGCVDKYIIVALVHSMTNRLMYWAQNGLAYTDYPFIAGIFSRKMIESAPMRYNNGLNTAAVPLTVTALKLIGFPSGALPTHEVYDAFCNIEVPNPEEQE